MNETTDAKKIVSTRSTGDALNQFAAANAMPESTSSTTPIMSITVEVPRGSLFGFGWRYG